MQRRDRGAGKPLGTPPAATIGQGFVQSRILCLLDGFLQIVDRFLQITDALLQLPLGLILQSFDLLRRAARQSAGLFLDLSADAFQRAFDLVRVLHDDFLNRYSQWRTLTGSTTPVRRKAGTPLIRAALGGGRVLT
jgi:hypothetical protein